MATRYKRFTPARRAGARDEPPPFSGRPRTGGTMDPITKDEDEPTMNCDDALQVVEALVNSMDDDEAEKFDTAIVEVAEGGGFAADRRRSRIAADARPRRATTRDDGSFERMFPEAAKVRVIGGSHS